MREQRETWTNSVKDVKDPFVNTVTRARHARAYTADKGETFTSFTDANSAARKRSLVDGAPLVILALGLGQRTGWAVRSRDGAIASGVQEFRPGRFEGGGMIWLRFRAATAPTPPLAPPESIKGRSFPCRFRTHADKI